MRILELGNYIAPAYAGMLLAEQGHYVEKWIKQDSDPILSLNHGKELWDWINYKKTLVIQHPSTINDMPDRFDAVINNFHIDTLRSWNVNPEFIAYDRGLVWVSIVSEIEGPSFDILAQCRSTLEFCPYIPFYIGDTAAGLFAAFKIAATKEVGYFKLGHASCLQKLVEGELILDVPRSSDHVPWDKELYDYFPNMKRGIVQYKGQFYPEGVKDHRWKWDHLFHDNGRIII